MLKVIFVIFVAIYLNATLLGVLSLLVKITNLGGSHAVVSKNRAI